MTSTSELCKELRDGPDARDDERCRWPECTCYGPQAPNHCRRQTKRTRAARISPVPDGGVGE